NTRRKKLQKCDSNKDDDSKQRVSHEADDDMGYDPSDVVFIEWLGSKTFNYKIMDHYTKNALWIYWIRGDGEVELTNEEFSDNEDEVAEVDEKPWTEAGVWTEPKPVKHTCKPFNYKTGCSEWPTCSWRKDGYYNGGNLLSAYNIGNSLHYQDLEWYEALEDSKLKEKALRNKAIMDGLINDDESSNDCWKRLEGAHEDSTTIMMKGNMKTKLIKKT
ncbi:hypothetical protein Tco_1532035, partial [Tanacetum coccineum]